jgi:hypothetical protein
LERQKERLEKKPKRVIGDAGYGGEENYQYCEDEGIAGLMKYRMYRTEQTKRYKTDIWRTENWYHNKDEKYYVCPEGRKLSYQESSEHGNRSGYMVQVDIYRSESCAGCPSKEQCTKTERRTIERNENMLRLKEQAKALLADEENRKIMKQRSVEVETVFGQIKGNQSYRRFLLRGLKKVTTE